ncbi:hypothetical protein NXS19_010860 [Fusarium pseudograminearum]|nr:hypothetical protein NXS19_010860 [Fusarium pseudograminearum]
MTRLVFRRARLRPANSYSIPSICLQRLNSNRRHYSKMPPLTHDCGIDAEPLHRYEPGGYHPVKLGATLKDGRYKVLHKLGWGGFSTTWAAKDQKNDSYVAVKVKVSEAKDTRELEVLQALSALPKHHPGSSHINQMLDHFTLDGPNGSHECLVLELVGPSVSDAIEFYCNIYRLPAKIAKRFAKQSLRGLDFLAANDIAHGDLHTRNIALSVPDVKSLSEEDFIATLGKLQAGPVTRKGGGPLGNHVPTQIVRPATFRGLDDILYRSSIKIIDFGEGFLRNNVPNTLNTPFVTRAPEAIFGDRLDRRVDLWSAGCLIFELITGQTAFEVYPNNHAHLVQQMIEETGDELPTRWQVKWSTMQKDVPHDDEKFTLQEWMEATYCFNDRKAEFTKDELARICEAIMRMLKFEPSLRATPSQILAQGLF